MPPSWSRQHMIRDLIESTPAPGDRADVCIVGAGAAGILLAVELARHGRRVVMLEGGGEDIEQASQDTYRSEIAGLRHHGIHDGRFRAIGGSTTRWGGQILEFDAIDFEQRPWVEGSGWPISKRELAPYYQRAIELEGLASASLEDATVWRELGLAQPVFSNLDTFLTRWCPETNFSNLHASTLRNHPLVTVWLHANAVSPIVEGTHVRGIRCRTLEGKETTFRADRFVWCMGGIESSRFFLQPELAQMPWQRNALLGRHFQDHVVWHTWLDVTNRRKFLDVFGNVFSRGYKYQPKIRLSRSLQQRYRTLNVAAQISFESESGEIQTQIKTTAKKLLRGRVGDVTGGEIGRLVRHAPLLARQSWSYAVARRAYVPPDARIGLQIQCEQSPRADSTIRLSDSRDCLGLCRTRLDWRISNHEVDTIRAFAKVAQDSLAGIARVSDPSLSEAPDDSIRATCDDMNHHMGGMRMSASASDGIVDLDLKLHGMDNGYVCSGAVFPTSSFSNPTHTVLALAVRLAEHIGRR
ncbi:FAD-dependent oxidoreductase [Cupriavidus metallidurans]|uniref:GMC family oxidoreductase n=2 Tax=Cupriavidus metallidurans TaxID=119219 RepID=Q1LDA1_CUPMC|nr:GMC family oxidoreductase [Cupriavidus metallidurans]ABF11875.1 conserved hypothetical protein [Cupriavidus metallidurans CH34]QGS32845.1 FAD-dependent oxidoreductase [Cupriavidus metallidurans]UBM08348.1 GMC family oxidoreductase [Cupriavidus metallidurans]